MRTLDDTIESVAQLTVGWRAMVLDRDPGADVRDLPGIAVRWADCGFVFWNCVTLTEAGADAGLVARRLHETADVMRSKARTGFLWVFEDLLTDDGRAALHTAAEDAGLEYAFSGTGMAGDILPLPDPVHPELTFARVTTDELLTAYADLNARAYGFPVADVRDGLAGSRRWLHEVHAYVGLRDGTPVTCAGAVETDGRLFVVLVATDPDRQRRGYGEAVTRKALHEGARSTGLTRATLHATEAGAPVYLRTGFEPNSRIHFFGLRN